jgi:hypothetical protein
MEIEFGLCKGPFNTKYAPLAALGVYYQAHSTLKALENVQVEGSKRGILPAEKLKQVLISLLAGCEHLSEVNSRLRSETDLALAWGVTCYLERSSLDLGLNRLSRTQIEQLGQAVGQIWHEHSLALRHDWRGFLLLELDLSGLPSGKGAEGAEKGYFSGKKSHRTPVSPGQCHPIQGNGMVRPLSGLPSEHLQSGPRRVGH